MATYVNDLRLKEIATGDEAGTWGTSTNTNLELIGEALGYGTQNCFSTDADATTTVADGATDPARAMYFKVTSSATLTATRTLTIAPNTISRVMFIENATTGSQSINISQGSGANVTIATGKTVVVYLDGAGSGAAVVDALALVDPGVTDTLAEVLTAGNTSSGTNIELTTTDKVQFRDSAIYLNSSADGQLDIVADTEVQIATTTVDLNGILDVSGNTTLGADVTFTGASYNAVWDSSANALEFGDNAKAVFGAGSDLQIYHDGSDSYISDQGTGTLKIQGDSQVRLESTAGERYFVGNNNGAARLYYDDVEKLATTSTGIDVTGTALADTLETSTSTGGNINLIRDDSTTGTDNSLGAIYWKSTEDSGSTVNIGAGILALADQNHSTTASGSRLVFQTTAISANTPTERLRLDSSGNLLVGTTETDIGFTDSGAGVSATPDGYVQVARSSANELLYLNKLDNDGDIVRFSKDGTEFGTIKLSGGDNLSIGGTVADHAGLLFGTHTIFPIEAGSLANGTLDLGSSSYPFKDIILSGSVDGGNGSAGAPTFTFSSDTNTGMFRAAADTLGFSTAGAEDMRLTSGGDLHVDGNVVAYSTTISDRRLKSNITNISDALDKVGQINGVSFVRDHNGEKAAGVVAQEIMEVLPEAVKSQALPLQTGDDESEYYVVEYDAVTGLLVEAVKELKARVEALEAQ